MLFGNLQMNILLTLMLSGIFLLLPMRWNSNISFLMKFLAQKS